MKIKVVIGVILVSTLIVGGGIFLLSNNASLPTSSHEAVSQGNSSTSQPAADDTSKLPKGPIFDFTLPKYDGSGTVNLVSYYNTKPTIIQFWATWCEICRGEFTKTNAIVSKYKDRINFIAVDWAQGDRAAVKDYIKELRLDPSVITFVMDENGSVGAQYGVRGTPMHVFIRKGGEVLFKQSGGLSAQGFEFLITKIINS